MKFILCNIHVKDDLILENTFDQKILKEAAYGAKIISKTHKNKKNISYDFVLLPILDNTSNDKNEEFILLEKELFYKTTSQITITNEIMFSLASALYTGEKINADKISIDVIAVVDSSNFGIVYTDGSFKKTTSEASYAVYKLLNEDEGGVKDDFTGKKFSYKEFSEKIQNGTNNIGELTGLKVAVENFDDKNYQIIISDSEYGIKCFREWYYTWKDNNFRNYAKKQIMNKDLIVEIHDKMISTKKIILFKWIKGHNDNVFNEMCDELAKKALE
jgi:ribonuclease HI